MREVQDSAKHNWEKVYFNKFTYCSHCSDFIWGLTQAQQNGSKCSGPPLAPKITILLQ